MKTLIYLLIINAVMVFRLQAQKVSDYTCKLDNGITIRAEQCWNQVWVGQSFNVLKPSDKAPLVLTLRTLGDLISSSEFKLLSSGKEVRLQSARPGTYSMALTFRLSGSPGTLTFKVDGVVIKAQYKTTVSVTLYDYQINIGEVAGNQQGLSAYASKVFIFRGNEELNPFCGRLSFYIKGNHDKAVQPSSTSGAKKGKINAGTYDVLITLGSAERPQRLWLENFRMKPDFIYNITTNLNAGVVAYIGADNNVKAFQLYPAGTAGKQGGAATPDRSLEILRCEEQNLSTVCPPGLYDVLLDFNNGARYMWRKNVAVITGARISVK